VRAKHLLEASVYYDPEALFVGTLSKGDGQSSDHYEKWSLTLSLFGLFLNLSRVESDPEAVQIPATVWGASYYKDGQHLARFWGWRNE
jgi:hypothetical protein